ncbi:hypothetical protein NAP1_14553 [Erythrobacter sp. NAP1]|nr:hypothetical protein NAP1_14553 [Erythrobacter sp. NAP1]
MMGLKVLRMDQVLEFICVFVFMFD